MKAYYEQGGVTLYHGDCREILPGLAADALITDPPFGINFRAATWSDEPEVYPAFIRWLVQATASVVPNGWAFVFQSGKNVARFPEWFPEGFRIFAACKNFVQMRPIEIQYTWDPVVFWRTAPGPSGHRKESGFVTRDFHVGNVAGALRKKAGHPSPRPLDTMKHVVAIGSRASQMVIDPFAGSGTTLVAAKALGRRAIGIDIEEKYCEIAAKRLDQEVLPLGALS